MKSANPRKQAPRLQLIHDKVIIQSLRDRIAPYPSILTSQRMLLAPPRSLSLSVMRGLPVIGWKKEVEQKQNYAQV